ncbi:MAG: DinB family protein [Dehalococcoidia bacterium]
MASENNIQDLIAKMAAEREKLLAQIESLSDEQAGFAPADAEGEAQWSPKEQCAHLAEMETAYRAWVERALVEENPDVARVRGDPVDIPLEEANQRSIREMTDQMRFERARTLQLIERLRPHDYERTATQPMFGKLTVLQWLRSYYRHDRMHQAQIAGREQSYQPRFVTGSEPDQRRTRLL